MEYYLSISVFVFGIITWIPLINGVLGHDVASVVTWVDHCRKEKEHIYYGTPTVSIGHLFHLMVLVKFFGKYNAKAFYSIMCFICSVGSVAIFHVINHEAGLFPAVLGSMLFSAYIASPRLEGNYGPFEQLLPLPLFASILCCFCSFSTGSLLLIILSGMLYGYAILIKQTAVLYLPGFYFIVTGTGHSVHSQLLFLSGCIATNVIPMLYYWIRHKAFWKYFATVWLFQLPSALNPKKYNKLYDDSYTQGEKDKSVRNKVMIQISKTLTLLFFLSAIGIFSAFVSSFSLLHLGFLLCLIPSVVMIFLRKTYFAHYWLNMIPWLAFFAGIGIKSIYTDTSVNGFLNSTFFAFTIATIFLLVYAFFSDKCFYVLSKDPYQFLRKIFGEDTVNHYKRNAVIGKYIEETTEPNDRILICGNHPHVLYHSNRAHFTANAALRLEEYINLYSHENPSRFDMLSDIFKIKIDAKYENEFHNGYPELIALENNEDFAPLEELTGVKYTIDDNTNLCRIFRADPELTEIMKPYDTETSNQETSDKKIDLQNLITLVEKGEWHESLQILKQSIILDPYNTEYILLLGDSLIMTGNNKSLISFYKRLIKKDKFTSDFKLQLMKKIGESLCHLEKHKEAEEYYQLILKYNNTDTETLNNLGVIYFNQNKIQEAKDKFTKVLNLEPDNVDAINNLEAIS